MKLDEYLTTVTEQIRCQKARELVSDELRDHILDQAEAYEAEGMFEEDALEKAVREMGDPVETGVSLDRVHRPRMEVGILVTAGMIGILSILLHGALGFYSPDLYGDGYLKDHIVYTVCGYILMLLVYRVDYSILAQYGRQIAAGFLAFMIVGGMFFGQVVNGMRMYINLGGFHLLIPMLMYLYIPLYAGILYQYRGEGYKAFGKIFLWAAVPMVFVFRLPSMKLSILFQVSFAVLFTVAVWKEWYKVNKKKVLTFYWMFLLGGPVVFWGSRYMTGRIADYQIMRLRAWLTQNYSYEATYQARVAAKCLRSSSWLGGNKEAIEQIFQIPGYTNDYIFVSLVSVYGVLAGILAAGLLLFLLVKIFRVSFRQRNQLGMILGCACGSVFLCDFLLSLGVNLNLIPLISTDLPFFSSSGAGIMVSYILLGLVLSVYRYKNILPEKPGKKAAGIVL